MLRHLFVAEGQFDGNRVERAISVRVFRVIAGFGTFAKEVHTLYLADEIVHHLSSGRSAISALLEVVSCSFDKSGGYL